ncbi:murein hydrolase activator EnvC family protein [Stakelama pacifica]|uniref:Septal ring factor EnvC (AmiA/AmiB activator) n=1 Tax=Stakelama pacifica TaxID=517720 RepID=A0A4R6FV31_9SPHN|nr:peptidoglycan DD-metalloendopeptidase family protein [Stakelama pacifica]TDN85577.1 septal ring factor EnvC (AmiA/AmiB activator) [Stakelama pacifica]GGO92238.1 hypothetical protein GCM10011329_08840 [Stakelama pacifica]
MRRVSPRLVAGAALALMLGGGAATMLPARQPDLPALRDRMQAARQAAEIARDRAAEAAAQADIEQDASAKARAGRAAMAERVAAAEADIREAKARVALLQARLAQERAALARQQAPLARAIAALQSMARRPVLLSLAQPGSVSDAVHVRAALQTIRPAILKRTEAARARVARIAALRAQAAQAVAALSRSRGRLEQERGELARLETRHRARGERLEQRAMDESDRALALGEDARSIAGRIAAGRSADATRAELAALPGPVPRTGGGKAAASGASGPAPYLLPVWGRLETGLGELSPAGVRSRGLTFAVKPGARVIAPAAGRARYAGRFRAFGTILILDHGDGWTTLITGLDQLWPVRGDWVQQGQALGNAPQSGSPHITVELRRGGQPVDMTALMR